MACGLAFHCGVCTPGDANAGRVSGVFDALADMAAYAWVRITRATREGEEMKDSTAEIVKLLEGIRGILFVICGLMGGLWGTLLVVAWVVGK